MTIGCCPGAAVARRHHPGLASVFRPYLGHLCSFWPENMRFEHQAGTCERGQGCAVLLYTPAAVHPGDGTGGRAAAHERQRAQLTRATLQGQHGGIWQAW